MPTRILLADDHEIVRQGLRLLLQQEGFEVAGEAANGQEAIRLARESCPDVALLDYGMPLLNGIGAAREIAQACPKTKVILLTMHTDDHYVLEALRMASWPSATSATTANPSRSRRAFRPCRTI